MAGRSRSCARWRLITGLLRTLPSRGKGVPERVVFLVGDRTALNVCRTEYSRRSGVVLTIDGETGEDEEATPIWQEAPVSQEAEMLRQWDAKTIRRLVEELPDPFRETIVLREINDLSYSEILSYRHGLFGSLGEISRFERVRGGGRRTGIQHSPAGCTIRT